MLKRSFLLLIRVPDHQVRVVSTLGNVEPDDHQPAPRPFKAIPGPRGIYRWPSIGSILLFKPFSKYTIETMHKLMDKMCDRYGSIFKFNMGTQVVLVSDPQDLETIFRNEGKYPCHPEMSLPEKYYISKRLKVPLTMLSGEEWHGMRTPVNGCLMKADSATHDLEPQNAVADDFVKILETRDLLNIDQADLFFRFASESIGLVAFNKRLGLLDDRPDQQSVIFHEAAKSVMDQVHRAVTARSFYKKATYREFERSNDIKISIAVADIMKTKEIMERPKRDGALTPDEANLLRPLASANTLTDSDVIVTMLTLYSAGVDATAKNLQVFFYNLAQNPDKQEVLRKEILEIIGDTGPLTSKALAQMTYLKACLKESFRLHYPAFIGAFRTMPVDVILSGYKIPAGTNVLMLSSRPARLHFDDSDKYLPERWLRTSKEREEDEFSKSIVLPFGHGPRNCFGRRIAVQEVYLATAKVLQRLMIELEPETLDAQSKDQMFSAPDKPFKFKFRRL
ncbi:unnamed protein product [Lymnaea stagnalis]|uniref:Cytochrome P450 n=1 Tax=Lymnaea stagnalis TaxID=6523 RepID=A0AAV2HPA6_LYMST